MNLYIFDILQSTAIILTDIRTGPSYSLVKLVQVIPYGPSILLT